MKKIGLLIVGFAFVLGGCSTTRVADPVEQEKLCSGTRRPYKVKGSWYTPQHHYNYKETGIASWYGPHFHGRPKSCGEIFNMHGISAAHKTLPIPSVVLVTNTKTGTNVKLLIDDRGPFIGDRIIDLSKGAATYLGICHKGLGEVCVECLPEESRAFAKFVSQYGRYGRDPNGRTWEALFREQFDYDDRVPLPRTVKSVYRRPVSKAGNGWLQPAVVKESQPHYPSNVKPLPISNRSFTASEDAVNEEEIEELLQETRAYLRRKRV